MLAVWRQYDDGIDRFLCTGCKGTVYNIYVGAFCQHCGEVFTQLIEEEVVSSARRNRLRHLGKANPPEKQIAILEYTELFRDGEWGPGFACSKEMLARNARWYPYDRKRILDAINEAKTDYDHFQKVGPFSFILWDDDDGYECRERLHIEFATTSGWCI